jgi:hypothetical protein
MLVKSGGVTYSTLFPTSSDREKPSNSQNLGDMSRYRNSKSSRAQIGSELPLRGGVTFLRLGRQGSRATLRTVFNESKTSATTSARKCTTRLETIESPPSRSAVANSCLRRVEFLEKNIGVPLSTTSETATRTGNRLSTPMFFGLRFSCGQRQRFMNWVKPSSGNRNANRSKWWCCCVSRVHQLPHGLPMLEPSRVSRIQLRVTQQPKTKPIYRCTL